MKAIATGGFTARSGNSESTTALRTKQALGARLKAAGLINDAQLDLALREQKRSGRLLGEVLIDLGFVSAEIITQTLANEAQTKVVDVRYIEPEEAALAAISYETAKRLRCFRSVLPMAY